MATITQRYQALHSQTLAKLEEAMACVVPKMTLPGGVVIDRTEYIKMLQDQLTELEKRPGVVPEVNRIFTQTSVAR